MDKYKGHEDSIEMLVKIDKTKSLGNNLIIQILVISFFVFLVASCNPTIEQPTSSQLDLAQPTITSPTPDLSNELTPTPTSLQRTRSPSNEFQTNSTSRPPTPTGISDDLIPPDRIAVNETQEAYEFALLGTPSPTPTIDAPLTENGPWLVDKFHEDLIMMNLDGKGLTRMYIDTHWSFPWPKSSSSGGKWLALEIGNRPDSWDSPNLENFPDNLAIRLLQLPPGQVEKTIPLISSEMILKLKQVEDYMPFPTIIHALFSSPMLWSPDRRYLAFVAALDGPSSDLYVYDTITDQIRRLTDGPNQAWLMSWSPDSRWILHAEAESYATHTILIGGHPRVKAVWVASPDGNQVRKVYDVDNEITQFQVWLSPSVYIEQRSMDYTNDQFNIHTVDIHSGEMTVIYPCFGSFTGITSGGDIIFWSAEYYETMKYNPQFACNNRLPSGFYVFRDGKSFPLPQNLSEAKWNSALEKFLLKTPKGIEIWDLSGQLTISFPEESCKPTVSPDGQWLAFFSPCDEDYQGNRRIRFYNSKGDLLQEYSMKFDDFFWNPDSSGIFFQYGKELWFLFQQDDEAILIHPDSGMYMPLVVSK